jgi:hypothetical protein
MKKNHLQNKINHPHIDLQDYHTISKNNHKKNTDNSICKKTLLNTETNKTSTKDTKPIKSENSLFNMEKMS